MDNPLPDLGLADKYPSVYIHLMHPIEHIRTKVFKVNQVSFARIAGTTQATVSRWEQKGQEPTRIQMARIREEAIKRNLDWHDAFFFMSPSDFHDEGRAA